MKVDIKKLIDWDVVKEAALATENKRPKEPFPTDEWKAKMLTAEHSPIRLLEYDFTIEDIRQWVTVHLVRHHEGVLPFVHTQRQDINEEIENITRTLIRIIKEEGLEREGWKERDYLQQGEPNDMDMACNAQAFINISRRRLCSCASPETRQAMKQTSLNTII